MAILSHAEDAPSLLDGEIELDEAYFGGRRKGKRARGVAGKVPVFGTLECDGQVHVSVVADVSAATLLKLTVKKVRRCSVVYTDRFGRYDSLMFGGYRHLKIDHQKLFSSGRVYINGLEGFWSWAEERLMKHHGVSKLRFPLYLKELEFRYNHRTDDLFDLIANYLCDLVPKQDAPKKRQTKYFKSHYPIVFLTIPTNCSGSNGFLMNATASGTAWSPSMPLMTITGVSAMRSFDEACGRTVVAIHRHLEIQPDQVRLFPTRCVESAHPSVDRKYPSSLNTAFKYLTMIGSSSIIKNFFEVSASPSALIFAIGSLINGLLLQRHFPHRKRCTYLCLMIPLDSSCGNALINRVERPESLSPCISQHGCPLEDSSHNRLPSA